MKDEATKAKFIELRASGKSLQKCANQLHIAKSTCVSWDKDLASNVAARKAERLDELYKEYGMVKETRIATLGSMLQTLTDSIHEDVLNGKLNWIKPEKKIELWLSLRTELMKEYTPASAPTEATEGNAIRASFMAFMLKVQSGEVSPNEMKVQAEAFAAMMHADKATTPNLLDAFGFGNLGG